MAWVFAGASLLVGALFFGFHTEEPVLAELAGACDGARYISRCAYSPLYDWLAGLLALLVFGLFAALMFRYVRRAPPPTVYCQRCEGGGWVRDLEPSFGRCPRCRHDRFTYYLRAKPRFGPVIVRLEKYVEPDVSGKTLVARWRSQSLCSRLWQPLH